MYSTIVSRGRCPSNLPPKVLTWHWGSRPARCKRQAFELFRQNPDGSLVSLIKTGSGGDTKSEWAQMAAAKARKRREMLAREKEPRPGGVHYDAVIRRTAQSRR